MKTKTKPELNGDRIAPAEIQGLVIERIQPQILELEIVGVTPLLVCAWSEKARRQMLEEQTGGKKTKKPPRDPQQEYLDALYNDESGEWTGIPAGGVKGCLVAACRLVDGLPMTIAKRMVFIRADGRTKEGQQLVRVNGDYRMHKGMVRLKDGTAMERFRPVYDEWSIKLSIEFLKNVVTPQQVANLVELAGFAEGLCEFRPGAPKNNTGDHGRFKIKANE